MGAFKFSPGHCGASPCNCGSCTSSICVAISGPCQTTDRAGATVTVKDHATGAVVGTATTDAGGSACVAGLAPGTYDVSVTKANCYGPEWLNQTLTCATLNLVGNITCLPYGARKFTVYGCFGSPLPGAAVAITGAGSQTVFTDSNGVAYYHYDATGTYSATITHSSGRFNASTAVAWTVANVCDSSTAAPVTLAPAAAYQCCDIQKTVTPASPYPISKTLKVTDPGGPIAFVSSNCSGTACGNRTMNTCSPSSVVGPVSCNGFNWLMPPGDIGSYVSKVSYNVSLSNTGVSATQSTPIYTSTGSGLQHPAKPPTDCSLVYQAWRIAQSDCSASAQDSNAASTGYTINSLNPLNVTITFASGGTFGPQTAPITQTPAYATSIVVSE